jgi:hypothetical protein
VYNALAKGIVFILEWWGGVLKYLIRATCVAHLPQGGRQGVGVSHTTNVVSVPNTVILNGAYAK